MSSDLIKAHKTVTLSRQNFEAGITLTMKGSKGLREFKQERTISFCKDEDDYCEWSLVMTFLTVGDDAHEAMNLQVRRSRYVPRVSIYDGGCTVALPDKAIQQKCPTGITPAVLAVGKEVRDVGVFKLDAGPVILPDEDFVITFRVAYSSVVEDEDVVFCKQPTVEHLTTQITTAYEDLCRLGIESDFTFVIGTEEIKAHKAILSARFSYFTTMLASGMVETSSNICRLEDVDAEAFKRLLKYIYCGKLPHDLAETARSLLPLADRFNLPELRNACTHWMEKDLTKENICETLITADLYQCADLKRKCLKRLNQWKSSVDKEVFEALVCYPRLLVELFQINCDYD